MLQLLEHAPIVLFLITYFLYGFFTATQTFVITTAIALGIQFFFQPRLPWKQYMSPLLIVFLGSMTLATKNPVYIIWAPTIKYLLAASAILTSRFMFKSSLMEKALQVADVHAPHYDWKRLDYGLSLCFLLMAVINIQVFKLYGSDVWTKFKLYSLLGWMFLFVPILLHIESYRHDSQSS